MAREFIQTAAGVFTPVADTQGAMAPVPVRYTRFRPSNITGITEVSVNVPVFPTPAQCNAGGGEDWNSGTDRFRVPKGGVYTVTVPAFTTANGISSICIQVITYNAAGSGVETKAWIMQAIVGATNIYGATDISVVVPEGGSIRLSFWIYQAPGTIIFDSTTAFGIWSIYLNEVAAPYVVANKGALVSSDAAGKVKIADDGTMSVNGGYSFTEVNTGETWTAGQTIYKRTFSFSPGVSLAPGASIELGSSGGITTVVWHEVNIDGQSLVMTKLGSYGGVLHITNVGGVATGGEVSPWIVTVWGCKAT